MTRFEISHIGRNGKARVCALCLAGVCSAPSLFGEPGDADQPFVININALDENAYYEGFQFHGDHVELTPATENMHYLILGTGEKTNIAIRVAPPISYGEDSMTHVMLSNVYVSTSGQADLSPFLLENGPPVYVTLAGSNTFITGWHPALPETYEESQEVWNEAAGLHVPSEASVIFDAVPTGGSLVAAGSYTGAGIGGCDGQNCGTITIVGGTIRAHGGIAGGAGVGGGAGYSGSGASGGSIIISGGDVAAVGYHGGAGIGDGEGHAGSPMVDISISGGIVTATGGSSGGASIGGNNYNGGWAVNISGGIVHALGTEDQPWGIIGAQQYATQIPRSGSITGSNTVVVAGLIHSNIVCEGGLIATNGRGRLLCDHVSIPHSWCIPSNVVLDVAAEQSLTIGAETAVTNAGSINVYGTLAVDGVLENIGLIRVYGMFTVDGEYVNFGQAFSASPIGGIGIVTGAVPVGVGLAGSAADPIEINVNTVATDGYGFTFSDGCLNFCWKGHYLLYGTGAPTTNRICVARDTDVDLVLSNVNIRVTVWEVPAFSVCPGSCAHLFLAGTNTFLGGSWTAGIHVPEGASILIDCASGVAACSTNGALVALGNVSSAGIGSRLYESSGHVTISGGHVSAYGGVAAYQHGAAGIGGGHAGTGGVVTLYGGVIEAQGSYRAEAIGGGSSGGAATGHISGNAFVFANTPVVGLDSRRGVLITPDGGQMYGTASAVTADTALPADRSLIVTNGQELVIGQNVTFINNGTITNLGAIVVYGTFINNGTIIGHEPQQTPVPPAGIGAINVSADDVVLAWPSTPSPVSVLFGKDRLTDRWERLDTEWSPTNTVWPRGRQKFFKRECP